MKNLGILVLGYRRKLHLNNLLESLKQQDALGFTHVWIDGYSHRMGDQDLVEGCQGLKDDYPTASWQFHIGNLGIEKLMLDGLTFMAANYHNIVVLEDDCFPTSDAVKVFMDELSVVQSDPNIFSVYGHHFECQNENMQFTRFQGWGWATTRIKLIPVLSQVKTMFMMSESEYLDWVHSALTPNIISRLDVTKGRDVINVLNRQFSWDSATALTTAILGLNHRRTNQRVIFNCGLGSNSGHFPVDSDLFRNPPFNMIGCEEVWQYFSATLPSEHRAKKYFGLNELDRQLAAHIPQDSGFFIEVGAYDGLTQSNSLYFERLGWRGILIEPILNAFEQCRLNRPLSRVINAACVSSSYSGSEVAMTNVGLMSVIDGVRPVEDQRRWIERGESLQQITSKYCTVPAKTLNEICDEFCVAEIDLLLIDVEGYELEVLCGLDFTKIRPKYILIEDSGIGDIVNTLNSLSYKLSAIFNEREFTRDLLFSDNGEITIG